MYFSGKIHYCSQIINCKPTLPINEYFLFCKRKYPERIHIYVDTELNLLWLSETEHPYQLPVFNAFPVEIGTVSRYESETFDWNSYKDIDDMYKVEELPEDGECEDWVVEWIDEIIESIDEEAAANEKSEEGKELQEESEKEIEKENEANEKDEVETVEKVEENDGNGDESNIEP